MNVLNVCWLVLFKTSIQKCSTFCWFTFTVIEVHATQAQKRETYIFVNFFLLPHSTDEAATENILKAELTMAALCGRLGLVTPRDAFITAICKASLPPHYALTVLSSSAANLSSKGTTVSGASRMHIYTTEHVKKIKALLGSVRLGLGYVQCALIR